MNLATMWMNTVTRFLIAVVLALPFVTWAEEPEGKTFAPLALSGLAWEVSPSGIGEVRYQDWTYGFLVGLPPGAGYGNVAGVAVDLGWCGQFGHGIWQASSGQSFWGAQVGLVNNSGAVRGLQVGAVNITSDIQGVGIGAVNYVEGNAKGVMVGLINASEIGISENFVGCRINCVHVGLINSASYWTGRDGLQDIVQIGLLNFVNGRLSWPFLNIRYSD